MPFGCINVNGSIANRDTWSTMLIVSLVSQCILMEAFDVCMLRFSLRKFPSRSFSVNEYDSISRNSFLPGCMFIIVVLLKGGYVKRLLLLSDTATTTATTIAATVLNPTNLHIHKPTRCFHRKRDLNESALLG